MNKNLRKYILTALLATINIILVRFLAFNSPDGFIRIDFGFLPIAVCSCVAGPFFGMLCGVVSDVLGALLFPVGPFFPGFTISAALVGLIYGFFLYRDRVNIKNVILGELVIHIFIYFILNSLWLSMLYEKAYILMLSSRIIKCLITFPLQIIVFLLFWRFAGKKLINILIQT